jgi:hypothetical protein
MFPGAAGAAGAGSVQQQIQDAFVSAEVGNLKDLNGSNGANKV